MITLCIINTAVKYLFYTGRYEHDVHTTDTKLVDDKKSVYNGSEINRRIMNYNQVGNVGFLVYSLKPILN